MHIPIAAKSIAEATDRAAALAGLLAAVFIGSTIGETTVTRVGEHERTRVFCNRLLYPDGSTVRCRLRAGHEGSCGLAAPE
jgi:hypothetical protein